MDLFDPFFTAEPDNDTSTTPISPTTPTSPATPSTPQSAQQDLLDIFGGGGGGGDFFSPPPPSSTSPSFSSSSSTTQASSSTAKDRGSSTAAFSSGGGGDDQDFFDLVDTTTTTAGQTASGFNTDPFGFDPFGGDDVGQTTGQDLASPNHQTASSRDPWGQIINPEAGSGFKSSTPFDDSMDMFFGGASQKAGSHPDDTEREEFPGLSSQDLFFMDQEPEPEATERTVGVESTADVLVPDDKDQNVTQGSGAGDSILGEESSDSPLTSDHHSDLTSDRGQLMSSDGLDGCLHSHTVPDRAGGSVAQTMTTSTSTTECSQTATSADSDQAVAGAEEGTEYAENYQLVKTDENQAASMRARSPVQSGAPSSGTLMIYEKTFTVKPATPTTDKSESPEMKDGSSKDTREFVNDSFVQQTSLTTHTSKVLHASGGHVEAETNTTILQDDSCLTRMSEERTEPLRNAFDTTSHRPKKEADQHSGVLEVSPLPSQTDTLLGAGLPSSGSAEERSDDADIPWIDSLPSQDEAHGGPLGVELVLGGDRTQGAGDQFLTVVEAPRQHRTGDVSNMKTTDRETSLEDRRDGRTEDGECQYGRRRKGDEEKDGKEPGTEDRLYEYGRQRKEEEEEDDKQPTEYKYGTRPKEEGKEEEDGQQLTEYEYGSQSIREEEDGQQLTEYEYGSQSIREEEDGKQPERTEDREYEYGTQLKGEEEEEEEDGGRQSEEGGEDGTREKMLAVAVEDDATELSAPPPLPPPPSLSSSSQPVKSSQEDPHVHLLGRPGNTTSRSPAVEGDTTRTGLGESTGEAELMMDAKGETHGGGRRRGPTGNIDDFQDDLFTTGTTSNQNVVSTAHDYDDNNSNDDDDASDDLRLDDFIGVSEMEQNEDVLLGGNSKSSSITSSSSIRRSRKLLRKKKQTTVADAASASTHPSLTLSPSSPSPVIVVEGVDAEEVEGVTLKDAGNEKGREEEVDGGDLGALMKTNDVSDVDMDFGVLEVSSHLNLDVSKQKTSLRKKGSLARRKRPTRHTVANPTAAASDSLFMDSTDGTLGMTFSSQTDLTDNVDSGKLSMFDSSSSDAVGTPKKCVPRKLPMMVPGLQDLRQSRLFNQERQKSGGGSHSAPSTTPTKATAAADSGEDPSAPEPSRTPEASSGIGGLQRNDSKSLYKQPVWLSEMKAKTSSAAPKTTRAQEATQSSLTSEEAEMDTHVEKTRAAGDDVEFVRASANLDPRTIQTVGISSTTSGSSSTVDRSTGRREEGLGLKRRGVSPGVGARTREQQQQDKPVWMRAAQEKTSRVADSLQGQKGNKQKEEEDDDTPVAPPWAAELKRKNRPLVGAGQTFGGNNRSEGAETPPKKSTESREREVYTPSLADRNKLNSTNNTSSSSSSLRDSGKGKATNGSAAGVRGPQGSPQPTGGIPQWKQELAERKKRRQSGQSGTAGSSDRRSSETSSNSGGGSDTTDSSSSLPAWRQQLKTRKSSLPVSERPTEEGGGSASPDWARQVQERRARLMKSGLLGDAANESQC